MHSNVLLIAGITSSIFLSGAAAQRQEEPGLQSGGQGAAPSQSSGDSGDDFSINAAESGVLNDAKDYQSALNQYYKDANGASIRKQVHDLVPTSIPELADTDNFVASIELGKPIPTNNYVITALPSDVQDAAKSFFAGVASVANSNLQKHPQLASDIAQYVSEAGYRDGITINGAPTGSDAAAATAASDSSESGSASPASSASGTSSMATSLSSSVSGSAASQASTSPSASPSNAAPIENARGYKAGGTLAGVLGLMALL